MEEVFSWFVALACAVVIGLIFRGRSNGRTSTRAGRDTGRIRDSVEGTADDNRRLRESEQRTEESIRAAEEQNQRAQQLIRRARDVLGTARRSDGDK